MPTHTTQGESFSSDLIAYQTLFGALVARRTQIPGTQHRQAFSWCCDKLDWTLTGRVRAQQQICELFAMLEKLHLWLSEGGDFGFPGRAGSNTRAAAVDVICSLLLLDGISKRDTPGLHRRKS